MAKKKISSKEADCVEGVCSYSPSTYLDFDDVTEIKGLELGQKVRIVLTGTVKSLEQRESYDDPSKARASICLKDFEAEIVPASSDIAKLFEDEDD